MRGRVFNYAAIARTAGFVAIAIAIMAAAIFLAAETARTRAPVLAAPTRSDSLSQELTRCQAIGITAVHDVACQAAWAENRRRFFTYHSPTTRLPLPATSSAPSAEDE